MTKHNKILLVLGLSSLALAVTACDPEVTPVDAPIPPGTDAPIPPGTDAPMEMTDAPIVVPMGCESYCTMVTANCTGANAQYDDMADCISYCSIAGWPAGVADETINNTLACRVYHVGVAAGDPVTHCPHAGPTGGDVCGASLTIRTEPAGMYTRVDRMGMPAVATALVPSGSRNDYNDANPSNDASLTFAVPLLGTLGAIHSGLDDDLIAAGLTPCSMTTTRGLPIGMDGMNVDVPLCAAQAVAAGGPPVVALVVPDVLTVNPMGTAGFPNGRMLADRAIDVTLAVILLDLESPTGCPGTGGGPGTGCTAATLATANAGMGINPGANDVAFSTTFPYLAAAH